MANNGETGNVREPVASMIAEPTPNRLGNRFVVHPYAGEFGVLDLSDDQLIKNWRMTGFKRIWRGSRKEAEELVELLNLDFGSKVSVVTRKGEPRENARNLAIARNRERKVQRHVTATKAKIAAFRKCETCLNMVKEGHQCPQA